MHIKLILLFYLSYIIGKVRNRVKSFYLLDYWYEGAILRFHYESVERNRF